MTLVLWVVAGLAGEPLLLEADGPALSPASLPANPDAIIGGDPVEGLEWPDAAGGSFGGKFDVGCTGTLIAPDLVLTAGHCADGITGVRLEAPDYVRDTGEWIKVKRTIEYPRSQSSFDIAVLILAEESNVEPRPIATGCIVDDYLVDGAEVVIAGYGALDKWGNRYTTEMYQAKTVITDADCTETSRGCQRSVSPRGELGAGGDGIDTCYGDSGGPLYLPTPFGTFLAGVTSRSYSDVDYPCGQGGIYVRADAVVDWVEDETGRKLPRAVCNQPPEPSADDLAVWKNGSASVTVEANDPEGDDVTFEIVAPPAHGVATIDDAGLLRYDARGGFLGADTVGVRVTDAEGATGNVAVDVHVLTRGDYKVLTGEAAPCGCAPGTPTGAVAGLAGLAALVLRRRRPAA